MRGATESEGGALFFFARTPIPGSMSAVNQTHEPVHHFPFFSCASFFRFACCLVCLAHLLARLLACAPHIAWVREMSVSSRKRKSAPRRWNAAEARWDDMQGLMSRSLPAAQLDGTDIDSARQDLSPPPKRQRTDDGSATLEIETETDREVASLSFDLTLLDEVPEAAVVVARLSIECDDDESEVRGCELDRLELQLLATPPPSSATCGMSLRCVWRHIDSEARPIERVIRLDALERDSRAPVAFTLPNRCLLDDALELPDRDTLESLGRLLARADASASHPVVAPLMALVRCAADRTPRAHQLALVLLDDAFKARNIQARIHGVHHIERVISWLNPPRLAVTEQQSSTSDGASHDREPSQLLHNAAAVYALVRPTGLEPELLESPAELLPTLRPYQKRAVAWMLSRERREHHDNDDTMADRELHPLWQCLPMVEPPIFYNRVCRRPTISSMARHNHH